MEAVGGEVDAAAMAASEGAGASVAADAAVEGIEPGVCAEAGAASRGVGEEEPWRCRSAELGVAATTAEVAMAPLKSSTKRKNKTKTKSQVK
jgi:hypothetical protein